MAVAYFVDARHMEMLQSLHSCLRNVKHVPILLSRMRTAQALISDWPTLYKTAYNAILLGDVCRSLPSSISLFAEIGKNFTPDLFRIATLIHRIVDFEESTRKGHFIVKPGVDDNLDQKKRTYNGLPDFMSEIARHELQQLPPDVRECSVIYLPQLGYILTIPETEAMAETKNYQLNDLKLMFTADKVVYYKSANTLELDKILGDTQCEITDMELEIMHKLQNEILELSPVLYDVMKYAAELDCVISLAVIAREFKFVKPEINTNGTISIIKGRHPLQELCVGSFVPNDTFSSKSEGKIKIITGPNASGKSIYLKQVGLIVYLAHIGSYVPAEKASVTLIDKIFTRIKTVESVSINMSKFCMELMQVSRSLQYTTEKSLVLIDEFGKGTESSSGIALLAATLDSWISKRHNCPYLLLVTHFHHLQDFVPENQLLNWITMEILRDQDQIVSLYKVIEGKALCSFARLIAIQAQLPQNVLIREPEIYDLIQNERPIMPCDPQTTKKIHNQYSTMCEQFLKWDAKMSTPSKFFNDNHLPYFKTPATARTCATKSSATSVTTVDSSA